MNFHHTHQLSLKQTIFYGRHAIRKHFTSSDAAVLQSIAKTDQYILDGGSLLHRLKWKERSTYSSIANSYASFTSNLYGKATIVFDGYSGGPIAKDNTHQHQKPKLRIRLTYIKCNKICWEKG